MFVVFAVLVGLIPVIPAVLYLVQNGKTSPVTSTIPFSKWVQCFQFFGGHDGGWACCRLAGLPVICLGCRIGSSSAMLINMQPSPRPFPQVWHVSALVSQ